VRAPRLRHHALGIGLLLLAAFEGAHVWFVMPLPGSQRMRSVEIAFALHRWRWVVRGLAVVWMLGGLRAWGASTGWRRWGTVAGAVAVGTLVYVTNFVLPADVIFQQPEAIRMVPAAESGVAADRLVVGIRLGDEARAYPLQFIGYHHFVYDTIAGRPVLVTYCTVCRTGRVFDPVRDGAVERFRLVGMDQFNAMLEDRSTGSWWRQANGEAVTGPLRGTALAEIPSTQMTLGRWLALHPTSLVMRGDPRFADAYAQDYAYERGTSRSRLTGTDPRSWQEKSWVVGLVVAGAARAYDWNALLRAGAINDTLGGTPVVLAVASDGASFVAFIRPDAGLALRVDGDSLRGPATAWALSGIGPRDTLPALVASQEFWHSWRTFHPGTTRYAVDSLP